MKKIISIIIALAMIMTMVNIPMVANAETELINVTEDYSSYTSDTSLDGWYLSVPGTTATFGAVDGGVEMKQVAAIPTINDGTAKNGNFSSYYNKILTYQV